MESRLLKFQNLLSKYSLNSLVIPTTNEFLVEYNSLEQNLRYLVTEFSGSTGDALLTAENLFLFVDGRYHIQADCEVNHDEVSVVKLQTGERFIDEMVKKLPKNAVLGIFARRTSQKMLETLLKKKIKVKLINDYPIDLPSLPSQNYEKVDTDKYKILQKKLKTGEAFLITNLEEVTYLSGLRSFDEDYSTSIIGKTFLTKNTVSLVRNIEDIELEEIKRVYIDKTSITAYDYAYLGKLAKPLKESPVKLLKSVKTKAEIAHYKEAFARVDKVMLTLRDFIEKNDGLSEFDIEQKLRAEFKKAGAKLLSFSPIVAIDENSALAHYSKASKSKILKNGSLVLIDTGAYFEKGLATDITRVFIKGQPTGLQKEIYTLVLKAHLHAFFTSNPSTGFVLDKKARKILENAPKGFVFNHSLGHGIGVSVHEAPPYLAPAKVAQKKLQAGNCFTIEPGLYKQDVFGVRLENSCYLQAGKIKTFVKMPFEEKLIDYNKLTKAEKTWLKQLQA